MSTSTSPKIYRPKPRRPFESSTSSLLDRQSSTTNLSPSSPDESLSRTQSILNLTSSTLLGIYKPTGYQANSDYDFSQPATPWGTGAETPRRSGFPPPLLRRASSYSPPPPQRSKVAITAALALRGILLFGIGMGYGVLVRHLHDDRQLAPFQVEGIIKPRNDWRYLVFWGVAGICLGSLMPWVDTLFSTTEEEGQDHGVKGRQTPVEDEQGVEDSGLFGADWTPVVRSVGAFVGIAYAIRKLPWATPLQASLTLFLVNPVLWYLIDRSAPGFILSSSIGAIGTSLLLASNPSSFPSPASSTSFARNTSSLLRNTILGASTLKKHTTGLESGGFDVDAWINRESFEAGIWILSVLFCSCVCFGNVGRRLALSTGKTRSQ